MPVRLPFLFQETEWRTNKHSMPGFFQNDSGFLGF